MDLDANIAPGPDCGSRSDPAVSLSDHADFEPLAASAGCTREVWNSEASGISCAIGLAAALVRNTKPELVHAVSAQLSAAKVDFAWVRHDLDRARQRCAEAMELLQIAADRLDIALAEADLGNQASSKVSGADANSCERPRRAAGA